MSFFPTGGGPRGGWRRRGWISGKVHEECPSKNAVIVEFPFITCPRDLMLAAFILRRFDGSSVYGRPDIDYPENDRINTMMEFSVRTTLEAAAKFEEGDVIAKQPAHPA